MRILFLIFIALSPVSPMFFRHPNIDLWTGAGHYFQSGIIILLAYSFFEKQKHIKVKNAPLSLLTLWLGLTTLYVWYQNLRIGNFNFVVVGPFINFLCFLMFYRLAFCLDRKRIYQGITYLSYTLCAYLLFCVLQYFGWGQFLKLFAYQDIACHRVVGFIGNETQNALYLAVCLPVFYLSRNRFSGLCACLVWAVLAITCSASAVLTAVCVTVFFSRFHRLSKWYYLYLCLGAAGMVLLKHSELATYFNPHGRVMLWKNMVPVMKRLSLTGAGLGSMNVLAAQEKFAGWRHAHNEYWQAILTVGIIGLSSILYCIYEYFRFMLKDRLAVVLASMFLGICVASLIYHPAHIWLMAAIGMIGYSFMYVLKNEGEQNVIYS